MVRGQPDFGAMAAKDVTASISDMGEVAARLGSIVTYDKRGDVIDFDHFEEPVLKWNTELTGAGSAIYLDSESCKSGSQSVKLLTGDVAGGEAELLKYIPHQVSTKIGLEVSWSQLGTLVYFDVFLVHLNGIEAKITGVRVDLLLKKLYFRNSVPAWEELATGIVLADTPFTFFTLKLVADFTTGYYKRLLFGNTEFDLSSEAIFAIGDATDPSIYFNVGITNMGAMGGEIWVEDIIWTQAEP